MHNEKSLWLTEESKKAELHKAHWVKSKTIHGFVDFRHVFRPHAKGVSPSEEGVRIARCKLKVFSNMKVNIQLAWDDYMIMKINKETYDLGYNKAFCSKKIEVLLKKGENEVILKLSNTTGTNHGG